MFCELVLGWSHIGGQNESTMDAVEQDDDSIKSPLLHTMGLLARINPIDVLVRLVPLNCRSKDMCGAL